LKAHFQEMLRLSSGSPQKASASFLGQREETRRRVEILAEGRRHFERYAQEFEEAWQKAAGDPEKVGWEDVEGLVSHYRLAVLGKVPEERLEAIEQVLIGSYKRLKNFEAVFKNDSDLARKRKDFMQAVLILERARLNKDSQEISKSLMSIWEVAIIMLGKGSKGIKRISNHALRILAAGLQDPIVRRSGSLPKYFNSLLKLSIHDGIHAEEVMGDSQSIERHSRNVVAAIAGRKFPNNFLEQDTGDGEPSYARWQLNCLQIQNRFSEKAIPSEASDSQILYDWRLRPKGDYSLENRWVTELEVVLNYQNSLQKIQAGSALDFKEVAKTKFSQISITRMGQIIGFLPILFWLGEEVGEEPEGIRHYPAEAQTLIPRALVARTDGDLCYLHLELEKAERDRAFQLDEPMKEEILGIVQQVADPALLEKAIQVPFDPNSLWVLTRLILRWGEVAAKEGQLAWARTLFQTLLEHLHKMPLQGDIGSVVTTAQQSLESSSLFLALDAAEGLNQRRKAVEDLLSEYKITVGLRRAGFSPAFVARKATRISSERELRPQAERFFELAIEHAASFDPHTHTFKNGVQALIQAIDQSSLLHQEKDRLLAKLAESCLPEIKALHALTKGSTRKKFQTLDWFQSLLLDEATLARFALYPSAEKILLERSSSLLAELRAAQFPIEVQGKILEVLVRLQNYMGRVHPELMEEANLDRLAQVSEDPQYQLALTDLYPSRRVLVDENLPVAEWNPLVVRRGLPHPAQAWEKIQNSVEMAMGNSSAENDRILQVLQAFTLREVEGAGKPTAFLQEAKDFFTQYQERKNLAVSGPKHAASGAMSAYAKALNLMSQSEKVFLEDLSKIPSLAWGLQVAERVFTEARPWSEAETRVWKSLLAAPTFSDALRKRELFLLVLADERFPLDLQRESVLGLGHSSQRASVIETLVTGYRNAKDSLGERRFYRFLAQYWRRVGDLPDDHGILLMDEEVCRDEAKFWQDFDRILDGKSNGGLSALELEIHLLKAGKLGERFFKEMESWLQLPDPSKAHFAFADQLKKLFPNSSAKQERSALLSLIQELKSRRLSREEKLDIIRMDLPAAFAQQAPSIRFLLMSFLKNMPEGQKQSLLTQLRNVNESLSNAEVFKTFFIATGLEKAGQFLSTMVGLVPESDRKVYAELQDQVPASSVAEVHRTVEQELKRPMREVFAKWEDRPVASASMGEVYRAQLKDGSEVYVKVLPPSKELKIRSAVQILRKVALDYAGQAERLAAPLDIPHEIQNFAAQLENQLDFNKERRNAGAVDEVRVPKYLYEDAQGKDLSKARVSMMRPAAGRKLIGSTNPEQRRQSAEHFSRQALKMLLVDGLYHADPHPGNAFWDPKANRLTWLDWGVIGKLNQEEQKKLVNLLGTVALGDQGTMLEVLQSAAGKKTQGSTENIRRELQNSEWSGGTGEKLSQLLRIAAKQGMYLEPRIMRAVSVLLTVEGVVKELDPGRDFARDLWEVYWEGKGTSG